MRSALFLDFKEMLERWHSILLQLMLLFCFTLSPVVSEAASYPAEKEGASGPIRIGVIYSLTGIAARNNEPLVEMVQLTVDQVNKGGGVLGRQLQLLVLDNQSTAIGALEAANKAVAARVTAVIGAHWSSHSLAMAPFLEKAGIPMITPASTNPKITVGREYIFRICFIDSLQGQVMARFAADDLQLKTVAILRNIDEQYSNVLGGYFSEAFLALGGKVLLDTGYRGNATDFSTIIGTLLGLKPDAIYIPGYTRDTALFMKQARKMGVTATFLGGDAWDMLGVLVGEAVEGSYQSVPWHPGVAYPESRAFQDLHATLRGKGVENLSTPLAYDAVMLLVDAIGRAGDSDPVNVREALANTRNFAGATGPITFDEHGDPQDKEVLVVKYVHGKTVFITAVKL